MAKWKKLSMALPAIAALIARMTAGRAGVAVLSDLLASRGGVAAATRGGAAAAAEVEGAAATEAVKRQVQYKTAEEMLKREKPQAPFGGVEVGGVMFSRPGPPPVQAPPIQAGGMPGGSPGAAGQEATEAPDRFANGVAKLLFVISPIAALGVVLSKAPAAAERFGRSLLDAQAPLRRFSGSINAAFAELERSDLLRQRDRAEATSGSTSTLAKAIDQLSEDTKEVRHAAVSLLNFFGIAVVHLARIVNWLVEKNPIISRIMKFIEEVEKFLGMLNPVGGTWHRFVTDLAGGKFTGKHNKNNKPGGP
jgi:hypothetical protein